MKTLEELKKEFLTKFNNLVDRMIKLEVIPEIQSTINERIPERGGFVVYDGTELWNWIQQAITEAREQTLKEVESIIIGKDDVPMPEYRRRVLRKMGGHDDIYEDDCTVKTNNLLRHEQRSRLKKLSQQEV